MYNIEIENPKNIEMYQYDKGNKITFDKDIEDLTQIHYECEGETDTQLIENNQALVPYSMTKTGKSIQCYFYVITATGERTKFNFTILIKPRPEPNKEISEEEEKTFLIEVKEIFQKIEEKVKVNDKTLNEIEQVKKQANKDLIKTKEDGANALITAKDDYLKILDNQKVIILGDIDSHKAVVLMDISNMGTSALNNIANREGVAIGNVADLEALVQGNINTNANQHLQNIKDEANSKIAIIQGLLGKISIMEVVKVEELPSEDISTKTLYLLPNGSNEENNSCDEYINLDGTVEGWEKVGSTQVDLKGYVKNTDVAGINKLGLVQIPYNGGLGVSANGGITIDRATTAEIKALSNQYKPIVPVNLKTAVETIGGVIDELDTNDKSNYVSAINEILKFATRERTWKKIRTITIPNNEAKGQIIDGVRYGYSGENGIKEIGFKTDENGNELSQYKITGLQLKVTPVLEININQGFASVGSLALSVSSTNALDYFMGFKNTTALRWFEYTMMPNALSMLANNPGQYKIPGKRQNFIDAFAWGGFEATSTLGEGTKIEVWAYGYWEVN